MHGNESQADHEKLVTAGTFSSEADALVAKSMLDSAGIDSMMSRDDCGDLNPALTMTRGIKLMVRREDFDQAKAILNNEPPAPL